MFKPYYTKILQIYKMMTVSSPLMKLILHLMRNPKLTHILTSVKLTSKLLLGITGSVPTMAAFLELGSHQ